MIKLLFYNSIYKTIWDGEFYITKSFKPSRTNDELIRTFKLKEYKLYLRCKNCRVNIKKLELMSQCEGFPSYDEIIQIHPNYLKRLWKEYINHRVPEEEGLSKLVDEVRFKDKYRKVYGYYGYSHRGGASFQIGDRLFDLEYKPRKEDYKVGQWNKWESEFSKLYAKSDDFDRDMMDIKGISHVIPFKYRGPKEIETLEEAKQAAINFANYMS